MNINDEVTNWKVTIQERENFTHSNLVHSYYHYLFQKSILSSTISCENSIGKGGLISESFFYFGSNLPKKGAKNYSEHYPPK